jgi:hypothetical protein
LLAVGWRRPGFQVKDEGLHWLLFRKEAFFIYLFIYFISSNTSRRIWTRFAGARNLLPLRPIGFINYSLTCFLFSYLGLLVWIRLFFYRKFSSFIMFSPRKFPFLFTEKACFISYSWFLLIICFGEKCILYFQKKLKKKRKPEKNKKESWKGLDKLDAGAFAINGYLNLYEKNLSWKKGSFQTRNNLS